MKISHCSFRCYTFFIIYTTFFGNISFGAFTSCCNRLRESFRLAKLRKTAQKALGRARKSVAEVESLNLGKEFCIRSRFLQRHIADDKCVLAVARLEVEGLRHRLEGFEGQREVAIVDVESIFYSD